MFTLLVVCTANVCRSPLAAYVLGRRLTGGIAGQDFAVVSAGTRARAGLAICPRVALGLSATDEGARYSEQHASQPLTEQLIAASDLILVPDAENRTRVSLLLPLARRRTFTMREADAILTRLEPDGVPPLPELVALMHGQRAEVAVSDAPRRRLVSRLKRDDSGIDIPDGHNLGSSQHRRTLEEVQARAESVAARLARAGSRRSC